MGINASNFIRTVREYNAAVQPGKFNPDKHRLDGKGTAGLTIPKSNYALTIAEPPFEAWPVRCGITFTYGGLKIDPRTGKPKHFEQVAFERWLDANPNGTTLLLDTIDVYMGAVHAAMASGGRSGNRLPASR